MRLSALGEIREDRSWQNDLDSAQLEVIPRITGSHQPCPRLEPVVIAAVRMAGYLEPIVSARASIVLS